MASKTVRRATQQAQLESELQFHPQETALAQLLASSRATYLGQRRHIAGATAGILAGIRRARPQLAADYSTADKTRATGAALVQASLAGLGAGADPWKAATAREAGAAVQGFGVGKSNALAELTAREQEAISGRVYNDQAARNSYLSDKSRIGQSAYDLAGQKGKFANVALQNILDAARKDAQTRRAFNETVRSHQASESNTRRGQNLSHADRVAAQQAKRDAKKRKGKAGLTPNQQQTRQDAINEARGWFARLDGVPGVTRGHIYSWLRTGQKIKPKGSNQTVTIPKIGSDFVNAGADLHFLGGLSPTNIHRLRARGVHVPAEWLHPRRGPAASAAAGAASGARRLLK